MLCFSFIDRFEIAKLKSKRQSISSEPNSPVLPRTNSFPQSSTLGSTSSTGEDGTNAYEEGCCENVEQSTRRFLSYLFQSKEGSEKWDEMPINPLDFFGAVSRDTNPLPYWRLVYRKVYRFLIIVLAVLLLYQGTDVASSWEQPKINSLFLAQCIEIYGDIIFAAAIGFMLKALLYNQELHSDQRNSSPRSPERSQSLTYLNRSYQYFFKCFLESPLLFALSQLSYSAFTVQFMCTVISVQFLPPPSSANYSYFFKIYFIALGVTLCLAFPLSLFVEKPCMDVRVNLGCSRKNVNDTSLQIAANRSASSSGSQTGGTGGDFYYKNRVGGKGGSHTTKSGIHLLAPPDGFTSVKIVPRGSLTLQGGGREGGGDVVVAEDMYTRGNQGISSPPPGRGQSLKVPKEDLSEDEEEDSLTI